MAYRRILQWPDPRLKEESHRVIHFDEGLVELVGDMYDTINVADGAGLAAPQIGIQKRVIILKCSSFAFINPLPYERNEDIFVLVNPELELSGEDMMWRESCLSVPRYGAKVRRKRRAKLRYCDMDGTPHEILIGWPFSGALQHECDHLDGYVFIDRLGKRARQELKKKIYRTLRPAPRKLMKPKVERDPMDTRLTHGPGKRKKKRKKRKK